MKKNKLKAIIEGIEESCYIIAEMSANHAGDIKRAIEIVHEAKMAGADCIKIQTYTPDTMTIPCDNEYFIVKNGTWEGENLYNLYAKAYTPWEWQKQIKDECDKVGIDFLSTPFDKTSVDFLEELNVESYKIASFELVDIPLLKYIASKGKPIILSTGMGTLDEIKEAVEVIKSQGNEQIILLKCSSAYPAIPDDMNLKGIQYLKEVFGVPVGLSDHSLGDIAAVTAVVLGGKVVEKHFCISRGIKNPDASFSMEPEEFKQMVARIRLSEKAMGQISFGISDKEENSKVFRRSIFVIEDIEKGDMLTDDNIKVIRPGYGLHPRYYDELIGKRVVKNIKKGVPFTWDMVEEDEDSYCNN